MCPRMETRMNESDTRSLYQLLSAWRAAVAGAGRVQPPAYDGPDVQLTAIVERVLTQQVRASDFAGSAGNAKNGEYALTIYIPDGQELMRGELLERVETVANRISRSFDSERLTAEDEEIPVKVWIGYETTFRAGITSEEDLIARATEAARRCASQGTESIGCLPADEA